MSEKDVSPANDSAMSPEAVTAKTLPKSRLYGLFVAPFALICLVATVSFVLWPKLPNDVAPPYGGTVFEVATAEPHPVDGVALYRQHCSYCHGINGDGQGSARLEPGARYFGFDKFKLTSTANGVPTDDDLKRVLKRGIPGSAMPAFDHLKEEELSALVEQVRQFAWAGYREGIVQEKLKGFVKAMLADIGEEPLPDELQSARINYEKQAREMIYPEPGSTVSLPKIPEAPTSDMLTNGQKVFTANCISCHGPKGEGDGESVPTLVNENGTKAKPRNLTLGMFKYGGDAEHLYKRIHLGIPGTPMAGFGPTLPEKDLIDLVLFVREISQGTDMPAMPAPIMPSTGSRP